MKSNKHLVAGFCLCASLSIFLAACTVVNVDPLPYDPACRTIYIRENPKVIEDSFVSVMLRNIHAHGFRTRVVSDTWEPRSYDYVLTYSALQSWDFVTYLSHADVMIFKDDALVASGTYHHRGGSFSLAPVKWFSTESKMTPVFDELFENYSAAPTRTRSRRAYQK